MYEKCIVNYTTNEDDAYSSGTSAKVAKINELEIRYNCAQCKGPGS